jgi:hypothetical protein
MALKSDRGTMVRVNPFKIRRRRPNPPSEKATGTRRSRRRRRDTRIRDVTILT